MNADPGAKDVSAAAVSETALGGHPLLQPFPTGWDSVIAGLVETVGSDQFPAALHHAAACCCPFDSLVVTLYPGSAPPRSLFHTLDRLQAAVAVDFYASGPYLLDPLFLACRNRTAPGVYSVLDLAPEAFVRSEYYRTFFRKNHIVDELGLLIPDGAERWIVVSLARDLTKPRFDGAEIARVGAVFATVAAAVRRQWGTGETGETGLLDLRMESFAADRLSPREREIVLLVLQGHSTPSAAALLGISEGTVKVHRHHAYAKLGIASQAELFSLAMRHLAASPS
ncbi:helix-turn-helix transcriptional regulator [Tropicimonas sp. IMCC34043]|uniref:helix-turn-helix transcriptional regulator n=1 Tax=Tropicimonas sp. IMCC34043 TaxID=2248760 RepID=UPI000E25A0D6|nr:helix-turn-helix transcriptional regulator [Tropicimonas sp. IMCC34043]